MARHKPRRPPDKKRRDVVGLHRSSMRSNFAGFHFYAERNGRVLNWVGTLSPNQDPYEIHIKYEIRRSPRVFVIAPELHAHAKTLHRFRDGSLCLYHPRAGEWDDTIPMHWIAVWALEWLYYYELWLEHGVWLGPEAPHQNGK